MNAWPPAMSSPPTSPRHLLPVPPASGTGAGQQEVPLLEPSIVDLVICVSVGVECPAAPCLLATQACSRASRQPARPVSLLAPRCAPPARHHGACRTTSTRSRCLITSRLQPQQAMRTWWSCWPALWLLTCGCTARWVRVQAGRHKGWVPGYLGLLSCSAPAVLTASV